MIKNVRFKPGITCPLFKNSVLDYFRLLPKRVGTTYGSKRIGTSPTTGKEVIQEFIGISNGKEIWESLHNYYPEDDVVDVAAFKKRHNL